MRLLSMILGMCIRKSLEKLFNWRLFGRKMWDMGGMAKNTPPVLSRWSSKILRGIFLGNMLQKVRREDRKMRNMRDMDRRKLTTRIVKNESIGVKIRLEGV